MTMFAVAQCREQNTGMLEKACLAIESAAKDYGVEPSMLFLVAHRWYDLHSEQVRFTFHFSKDKVIGNCFYWICFDVSMV